MLHAVSPCPCRCVFLVAAEFTMSTTLTRMDRMDLSHFRTFAYPLQHSNPSTQPAQIYAMPASPAAQAQCGTHQWPKKAHCHLDVLDVRVTWSLRKQRDPQLRYTMYETSSFRGVVACKPRCFVTFVSFSGRQGRLRFESIFEANTAWPSIDRIRHASVWIPSTESVLSVLWLSFDEKWQFWWEVSSEYFEHFSIRVSTRSCCSASHVVSWQSPQGLWTSLRALHSLNKARAKWNSNELQNSEVVVSNYNQNHWTLFLFTQQLYNSY